MYAPPADFVIEEKAHGQKNPDRGYPLSQRDIAAELGSESTVSLVLSGKRRLNRDHIARLSQRFHVSPSVFFGKL